MKNELTSDFVYTSNTRLAIGRKFYSKRTGEVGQIIAHEFPNVVVQFKSGVKKMKPASLVRRYKAISPLTKPQYTVSKDGTKIVLKSSTMYSGEVLMSKFISILNDFTKNDVNDELVINISKDRRTVLVKYNGYNVFDCKATRSSFRVRCHPKSLAPMNFERADKVYAKSIGRVLRVEYRFNDIENIQMMQPIIVDGLYFRKNKEDFYATHEKPTPQF